MMLDSPPDPRPEPFPTETRRAKLADLRLLERNARFMRQAQFDRLVRNVRRDGALTSVPLAVLDDDGGYTVVSGNHRVKAALAAGVEEADVMFVDQVLDRKQRLGLQLSHNAIAGEDDPTILKELYEQIDDLDWQAYAGLDDKTLDLLEKVSIDSLSEANLQFETVTLTFLPDEIGDVKRVLGEAREQIDGRGEVWLAAMGDYDRAIAALANAGDSYGVSNQALSLRLVLAVFESNLADLTAGWWDDHLEEPKHQRWVPVATVLSGDRIPPEAAGVVKQAVEKLTRQGDITQPWQFLEYAAAEILAAPDRTRQ